MTCLQSLSIAILFITMIGCLRHASAYTSALNRRAVPILSSLKREGTVRFERSTNRVALVRKFKLQVGFGGAFAEKKKTMKILKYPHPQLRGENADITSFDGELKQIVNDMFATMYDDDGIGLAAPQVGINKKLMVFNQMGDPTKPESEMVLANPIIIGASEEKALGEEGCLSFPQIHGQVERNTWIEVKYQTITGESVTTKFEGKPAIIFQHEFDHLNKVLFIDRLVVEDQKLNEKRLAKIVKKYGAGAAV
jgi:peptide deformylase